MSSIAEGAQKSSYQPEETTVAVIGLGYVGLPLVVEFGLHGFNGIGIDTDAEKVDQVNAGVSYISDVPTADITALKDAGRLRATTDFSVLQDANAIIICVPTPLRKTKEPDITHILSACEEIAKNLRSGQVIVLESTTYPGTTDEVILPLFEKTGLEVGKDFFLAFSPERVDPGNPEFLTQNICKIVGGVTPECTDRAVSLYRHAIANVQPVSNARVAETAKLLENTYRSVNIALVNELALMCQRLGIDVWEVIEAAATKPFGYQAFFPGPGIGGHCIPLDPYYLTWRARVSGYEAKFIGLAGEINSSMPHHVVALISDALNEAGKCVKGSSILILGAAYKKNVSDVRESPALVVMELLEAKGAKVSYADPFVPTVTVAERVYESLSVEQKVLESADCVAIITNHDGFDYELVGKHASLIIDTRNAMKGVSGTKGAVIKL